MTAAAAVTGRAAVLRVGGAAAGGQLRVVVVPSTWLPWAQEAGLAVLLLLLPMWRGEYTSGFSRVTSRLNPPSRGVVAGTGAHERHR